MIKTIESANTLSVSLAKVKSHLRIEHDEEDALLKLFIKAATNLVENETGKSLITKVFVKRCAAEKNTSGYTRIKLEQPPLVQIISVAEILKNNETRPIKKYLVEWDDTSPCVLVNNHFMNIEVIYEAGYGNKPSMIPADLRQAILMLVGEMYENRTAESSIENNSLIRNLLSKHKIISLA